MLQLLVRDLSEAEQQSSLAHRANLQCMDHLLEVQESQLAALDLYWNNSLEELSTEYNTERYTDTFSHHTQSFYLVLCVSWNVSDMPGKNQ